MQNEEIIEEMNEESMSPQGMKLFKITRGNAVCYILNNSGIPIIFDVSNPDNPSHEDFELFKDLHRAYSELPGDDYDFFSFCSNEIIVHETHARKFVAWLKKTRSWKFEVEYVCPYTNRKARKAASPYVRL